MKCRVCNTDLEYDNARCPYCHYRNQVVLNIGTDDSSAFRKNLLSKVSDVSVTATLYDPSKSSASQQSQKVDLFDGKLFGADLFGKIVWSKDWVAHPQDDEPLTVKI